MIGFVKITGRPPDADINGESTNREYRNWIEIESFQLGNHQDPQLRRSSTGDAHFVLGTDITAYEGLAYAVMSNDPNGKNGRLYESVVVVLPTSKNGIKKIVTYTFRDVVFVQMQSSTSLEVNQVSFTFKKMAIEFDSPDGKKQFAANMSKQFEIVQPQHRELMQIAQRKLTLAAALRGGNSIA